jgi:hypothetical protein
MGWYSLYPSKKKAIDKFLLFPLIPAIIFLSPFLPLIQLLFALILLSCLLCSSPLLRARIGFGLTIDLTPEKSL